MSWHIVRPIKISLSATGGQLKVSKREKNSHTVDEVNNIEISSVVPQWADEINYMQDLPLSLGCEEYLLDEYDIYQVNAEEGVEVNNIDQVEYDEVDDEDIEEDDQEAYYDEDEEDCGEDYNPEEEYYSDGHFDEGYELYDGYDDDQVHSYGMNSFSISNLAAEVHENAK